MMVDDTAMPTTFIGTIFLFATIGVVRRRSHDQGLDRFERLIFNILHYIGTIGEKKNVS